MGAKAIINVLTGFLFISLTVWKGPTVAGAVFAAIAALLLLLGTLKIIPKSTQEYIDDLEQAVKDHAPPDVQKKILQTPPPRVVGYADGDTKP
jgi:hypothetical protein